MSIPQYPPPSGSPYGQTPQPPDGYGVLPAGYSPYGMPVQPQRTTCALAIVSFVCGIAGWILLPVICSILAVVLGHIARREIRNAQGSLSGNGFAITALILGYLQLVVSVIVLLVVGLFFAATWNTRDF